MSAQCEACGSCGMVMEAPEEFPRNNLQSIYCVHCSDEDGNLTTTFDAVVEYTAKDLVEQQSIDMSAALQLARDTISLYPAWKT